MRSGGILPRCTSRWCQPVLNFIRVCTARKGRHSFICGSAPERSYMLLLLCQVCCCCRCDQATAAHRLCWGDDCHDNRQGLQDTVAGDGWLPPTRGASQSQPCCLSCVRLQVNTLHCSLYCCPGLECFALRVGAHSSPASCQPVHAVLISLPYVRGAIVRADQRATPR